MNNLLYIIAIILLIGWFLGYFVFVTGSALIHVLLVLAVVAILLRIIKGDRPV